MTGTDEGGDCPPPPTVSSSNFSLLCTVGAPACMLGACRELQSVRWGPSLHIQTPSMHDGTPTCTFGAPACTLGAPVCMLRATACTLGSPGLFIGTPVCTLGTRPAACQCNHASITATEAGGGGGSGFRLSLCIFKGLAEA